MATGRQAFSANTAALLHDAILRDEPQAAGKLNLDLPSRFDAVIEKALKKDCESRYQSAREMREDLAKIPVRASRPEPKRSWMRIGLAASALALVGGGGAWYVQRKFKTGTHDFEFKQLTINSSDDPVTSGSISPDGEYLAYTDKQGLHVKEIASGTIETIRTPDEGGTWEVPDFAWMPGSREFVANEHRQAEMKSIWTSRATTVWRFSRPGGSAQKLQDQATAWGVLSDGSISVGKGAGRFGEREMWLLDPKAVSARKILQSDENAGLIGPLAGSRDGNEVILYLQANESGQTLFSLDLKRGAPVTVLGASEMKETRGGFAWLPDGRLLFQKGDAGSGFTSLQDTCNFWTLPVDRQTGKPAAKPERLTNWTGLCAGGMNVTADGRSVAFLQESTGHGTAYVAEIKEGGANLGNVRHFTQEDGDDAITDWTADSKTVILSLNRGDHYELYKQSVNESAPTKLTAGQGRLIEQASVSPDGKSVILQLWPTSSPAELNEILRVPIEGGAPETLMKVVELQSSFWCARTPSTLCVMTDLSDDNRTLTLSKFDPQKGREQMMARFNFDSPLDPRVNNFSWSLSPDGTRFAIMEGARKPIRVYTVRGEPLLTVMPNRNLDVANLIWAADGKGFYGSNRAKDMVEIVWIDLQGNTHVVWKSPERCFGVPSPDGRSLAIYDWKQSSNMWKMKYF